MRDGDVGTDTNDYRVWVLIFIVVASTLLYAANIVYKFIIKRLKKTNNMRMNKNDIEKELSNVEKYGQKTTND